LFQQPLSLKGAFDIATHWLALPSLAALAIEHGALLASTDRDFSRFPGLEWLNPLEQSAN